MSANDASEEEASQGDQARAIGLFPLRWTPITTDLDIHRAAKMLIKQRGLKGASVYACLA